MSNQNDIQRFTKTISLLEVLAVFETNWVTPPKIKAKSYKSTREILEISVDETNKCLYNLENKHVYSESIEVINLIKEYLANGFTAELVLNNYWIHDL